MKYQIEVDDKGQITLKVNDELSLRRLVYV
jgi:hypothetical protein